MNAKTKAQTISPVTQKMPEMTEVITSMM